MKKFFSLLFCCIFILSSICSCSKEEEKSVLYANIESEPETLDPQAATDNSSKTVIMNIFEGLVTADENGKISEGAASSYTVSQDGIFYVFSIREDAKWNNGEKLTSEDFRFGLLRALDPEICSNVPEALLSISNAKEYRQGKVSVDELGIKSLGHGTLSIILEKKNDDFLYALTQPQAMPCNEKFFNSTSGQYGKEDDKIISNGTYSINDGEWSHGEYIYLEGNSNYVGTKPPKCEGISLTIGMDSENIEDALKDGNIDVSSVYSEATFDSTQFNVTQYTSSVHGLLLNVDGKTSENVLSNDNIRKALIGAIDRNTLLSDVGEYKPANDIFGDAMIVNGSSYRDKAGIIALPEKNSDSQAILNNELKSLNLEQLPEITILCTDNMLDSKIATHIIECWNFISDTYVNKEAVSEYSLLSAIDGKNFSAAIVSLEYAGETPAECLQILADSGVVAFEHEEYKSLLKKLDSVDTSLEASADAERFLIENGVFYPVYYGNNSFVSSKKVSGVTYYPYGGWISFVDAVKIQ